MNTVTVKSDMPVKISERGHSLSLNILFEYRLHIKAHQEDIGMFWGEINFLSGQMSYNNKGFLCLYSVGYNK